MFQNQVTINFPPNKKTFAFLLNVFDEADAHQNQIRDLELGSEGKTCLCCGKSKKVKITDAAIKVESETCWVSSEQQIDMRSVEEVTLWRPKW